MVQLWRGAAENDCGLLPNINQTGLRSMYMRKVPCCSQSVVLYDKVKEGAIDKLASAEGRCVIGHDSKLRPHHLS